MEEADDKGTASTVALPRVAVLLAAFNGVAYLEELLSSVLGQCGVQVQIFASVDLSTDGTEAWLSARALNESRLVLLPTGQRFGSAAANFLRLLRDVDFSDFDLISLADQDDIWLPDKLRRAHDMLEHSGADAYSSNVLAFWPDGRRELIDKAQAQRPWDFLFEGGSPGCTYVLRRSLALEVKLLALKRPGELAQVHHHDWLIYAYARANGKRWLMDARPGAMYRQHAGNLVGANLGWRAFVQRAQVVLSGAGIEQAVLLAGILGLEGNEFVRRMSCPGRRRYFYLARHARQCRRRAREQVLFGLACLCLALIGDPK